jgi:DNA-binding winged helix-turn-helix (wHTH) protein
MSNGIAYVFPPYHLDPAQRLLTRDGQPIYLTPKEFDTLLALVEAAGTMVEKEALIARVWPETFVGDGSLARNISVLRKALGGEVIETLPRRGYRLTVPVTVVEVNAGPRSIPAYGAASEQPVSPDAIPKGTPWWKRRLVVGAAIGALALLSIAVSSRLLALRSTGTGVSAGKPNVLQSVVIQKEGAIDPLDEGFKLYASDGQYQHVMRNLQNRGYDRWKLITKDQNYYYRPLSEAEKSFVLQRDWKLSCVCAVEKGAAWATIDLGADRGLPRFDIHLFREGNKSFVGLVTQISPEGQWLPRFEFSGAADVDHPHTYELRYDHVTGSASLWIDGQRLASGYRGHLQFRENTGLNFGVSSHLDADTGIGVFREVRFEAQ